MGGSSGCVESSRIFEERKRKTKTDSAPIPSLLISPSLLSGGFGAFSALPAGYLGWLIVALGGVDFFLRDQTDQAEVWSRRRGGTETESTDSEEATQTSQTSYINQIINHKQQLTNKYYILY